MSYLVELNLLQALDRRKVPEDFLSAAFAHLLRYLADRRPSTLSPFLSWLLQYQLDEGLVKHMDVMVQHPLLGTEEKNRTSKLKRPDITIKTPAQVTYIEVKRTDRTARLGDQLQNYVELAKNTQASPVGVLLLSHYHPDPELVPTDSVFLEVKCWYQVADQLAKMKIPTEDAVGHHLVNQFLEFLQQGGLAVDKVEDELVDGLKSFMNLNTMMVKVLEERGAQLKQRGILVSTEDIIWTFTSGGVTCKLHLTFDDAGTLVYFAHTAHHPRLAQSLPKHSWDYEDNPRDPGWWYRVKNLSDEDFFSLKTPEQVESLTDFVKSCQNDLSNREKP